MDFDKLLKQAKAKQKVAEHKHVQQRQHKKETRKREIDSQKEEKKKAAVRLKEMKETVKRKQLEYKGLISSNKNSQSTASSFVPSPPAAAVSGPTTSSANKDRVKDKGRDKGGGATPVSSSSKQNKNVSKSSSGAPITKHTGSSSSLSTGKPNYSNKSTPSSSKTKSSKVSPSPSSSSAKSNSKSSISHSGSNSAKPKGKPVVQTSNFQDLLKTAKQNASGDKIASKLDKSACTGKLLDGTKLKEPTRSSSPVGRSLLERNHLRLKNKRSYDVMKQGMNPRGTLPGGASSGNYSAGMGLAKSSEFKSRLGSTLSPTKSNDLVRRPLRSPVTSCPPPSLPPSKHNGMRSSSQLERADKMPRQGGSFASGSTSSKARATTAPQQSTSSLSSTKGGSGGVRGSKTPFPPLSSLTPQQIQKLKAARAAAALSGGGMPPTKKKKALNPTAFYGSAAATILQRKGQPKLTASGPLKYTSSYVDEMMDYLRSEGVNGVEDLYSDEEVEEMDDFIASDDEFIDDSEDDGDYSSAIRKIFGYDRSRYADYEEDDDNIAMESSYAQQEFEETRSARIGRREDEEDIRREQQQLAKKKGKGSGKLSVDKLKQSKLTFR